MKLCISGERDDDLEVACSRRCGWSEPLSEFDQDQEGNYTVALECPDCDDGYSYLPGTTVGDNGGEVR